MNTKETTNSDLGSVSRIYLVLYENNPNRISGSIEKFDCEVMPSVNFEANRAEDFASMKKWVLKNGKKIYILEAINPLVKIIPEAKVFNNCR